MVKLSSIANGIFAFSGVLVIIYNEHYEFEAHHQQQWQNALESLPPKSETDIRLLFVVDLHLRDSISGPFLRWDAARNVAKYFTLARLTADPDVIIFMGDIVDWAGPAGKEDSKSHVENFRRSFDIPERVMSIFVASDPRRSEDGKVDQEKIDQFEGKFAPMNEVVQYKHIRFYKMDFQPFLHAVPEPRLDKRLQQLLSQYNAKPEHGETRILLSHHGISDIMLHRHITIMQTLHPSYAFSAHTHYSGYSVHDLQKLMDLFNKVMPSPKKMNKLDPRGSIKMEEYKVPTSNYLRGVPSTAFTVTTIDSAGELHYALLWLPSRYRQLRFYFFYFMAAGLYIFWKWCRRKRQYR